MSEIVNQRAILDRRALSGELNALAERSRDPAGATVDLQAILRRHLTEGRAEIRRRFEANPRGATAGLDAMMSSDPKPMSTAMARSVQRSTVHHHCATGL